MRARKDDLLTQYDRLLALTEEIVDFQFKAIKRLLNPVRSLQGVIVMTRRSTKVDREQWFKKTPRNLDAKVMEILYTKNEKKSILYKIMTLSHPMEGIRQYLRKECKGYNYGKLYELHASMSPRPRSWTLASFLAIILAFGSFLLTTVPTSIVKMLGWEYDEYQMATFYAVAFALIYVTILAFAYFASRWKDRQKKLLFERIVAYIKIVEAKA